MVMTPTLAITAFRSAVRIGRVAADAFAQHAYEQPVLIPVARAVTADAVTFVDGVRRDNPDFKRALRDDTRLKEMWKDGMPEEADFATLEEVALRFQALAKQDAVDELGVYPASEIAAGVFVAQWAQGKGPVDPAMRVLVGLVDVGLEFVGAHPQVLGVGSDGEKLVGAIATSVSAALPDSAALSDLGPRHRFGERLAALALRSTLSALTQHTDLITGQDHVGKLMEASLQPLVEGLPQEFREQVRWRDLNDAFLGPALNAALLEVSNDQQAFLGGDFASDRAAGLMVSSSIKALAQLSWQQKHSQDAVTAVLRSAVSVAAQQPAIVLGDLIGKDFDDDEAQSRADQFAIETFRSVFEAIESHDEAAGERLGTAIALSILDTLKSAGITALNTEGAFADTAGKVLSQVFGGLSFALENKAAVSRLGEDLLRDVSRTIVTEIAKAPHILVGDRTEIQGLVTVIASAIAADTDLILTKKDWIAVAQVAAQEAALNPGRIFEFDEDQSSGALAGLAMKGLLKAASNDLSVEGRSVGPVLHGGTLKDALIITLRALGANITGAAERHDEIRQLADRLNAVAAKPDNAIGSKEWLRLFRAILPNVIATGTLPELSDSTIDQLLQP